MSESHSDIPPQITPGEALPHRPADDSEEIYFQGSPLLRGELGHVFVFWLAALICIAIPILLRISMHKWPNGWITIVAVVIGICLALVPILRTKTMRFRITNYRIDFERGLLSRNVDTLELWHVEDIRLHQSFIDRLMGVGTITVMSHDDTTPRLEINGIPNPRPVFDQLKQRIIAVKRQSGVLKMDTGN